MEVLLGSNFSPVKASYKIKRKKLASDLENLSKVEKPSVSLQDQKAPLSLNTKRLPLQSIDEVATGTFGTVNGSQKEANYPSSQANNRKKVHIAKDQNTSTTAGQTKTTSLENMPRISHTQPQHPNPSIPKAIPSQAAIVHKPGGPRTHAPQPNSSKENKNESLGTLQKNREIQNSAGTWRKETVNLNVEEAMRNKMKYIPHVQQKEVKYGNHFVPVLPSFLIRDN